MESRSPDLASVHATSTPTRQSGKTATNHIHELRIHTTASFRPAIPFLGLRQDQDPILTVSIPGASPSSQPTSSSAIHLPIFLSPVSLPPPSSSTPSSAVPSSAVPSSSGPSPSFPPSPSSKLSSSSAPSPSISAGNNATTSPTPSLRFTTFIPAIIAGSVFLLAISIWMIYRCCKRRSRKRRHSVVGGSHTHTQRNRGRLSLWNLGRRSERDGELICGPQYVGVDWDNDRLDGGSPTKGEGHPDQFGHGHNYQMVQSTPARLNHEPTSPSGKASRGLPDLLGYGQPRFPRDYSGGYQQPQFRWPSMHQQPAFDVHRGFNVPPSASGGMDPFLSPVDLIAPGNVRRAPPRTKTVRPVHKGAQVTSPPVSDATSVALRELYDSLSDVETEGGHPTHNEPFKSKSMDSRMTAPWESLRHKSIKRGILEKVEQSERERSKFSNGVRRASGAVDMDGSDGRRRKSHVRQDSDVVLERHGGWAVSEPLLDGMHVQEQDESDVSPRIEPTPRLEVRNPSNGAGRLGTLVPVDAEPEEDDLDERLPSPSRPHSTPAEAFIPLAQDLATIRAKTTSPLRPNHKRNSNAGRVSRDVLPPHPAQIMSPPLQNQMFFLSPVAQPDVPAHSRSSTPAKASKSKLRPKADRGSSNAGKRSIG